MESPFVDTDQPRIRKHSYLSHFYHAVLALPLQLWTLGSMTRGGARGQNLGYLRMFSSFSFIESIVFGQQVELHVEFLFVPSDLWVRCPMVGLEVKI